MGTIDLERHRALAEEGYLQITPHTQLPLLIHNYTAKAQYDRFWTPETLAARGLITDLEGKVLARPFGKFFNLDEHISLLGALPNEAFEVYEKLDGSLGVLYVWEGKPYIATRGSFHSTQADRANRILRTRYGHLEFDPRITYLFEIIYPENRIVVDYRGMEDLVLLAMTETATGREVPFSQAPAMPLVKRYDGYTDLEALRAIQEDNREGFVIRFEGGLRVKLKFEEYVRLHRVMTGMTARTVWEHLRTGQDLGPFLEMVPDEFYKWVRGVEKELREAYAAIEAQAQAEFKTFPTRKEAAEYFLTQCSRPAILFKMLDGKAYSDIIWQDIRPEHRPAFLEEEDN